MFRGPHFIVSIMQVGTTPIVKIVGMTWTQHQLGIEPLKPLGQCWVPPIVAFYDEEATKGLFTTRELHQKPPPRIPTGSAQL